MVKDYTVITLDDNHIDKYNKHKEEMKDYEVQTVKGLLIFNGLFSMTKDNIPPDQEVKGTNTLDIEITESAQEVIKNLIEEYSTENIKVTKEEVVTTAFKLALEKELI